MLSGRTVVRLFFLDAHGIQEVLRGGTPPRGLLKQKLRQKVVRFKRWVRNIAFRIRGAYIYSLGQFLVFFIVMKRRQQSCAVVFLAATYLFSGIVPEMVHRDPDTSGARSSAAVAPHSCGAHERHVPLEALPACALCMMTAQRSLALVDRPNLDACYSFVCSIPPFSPRSPSATLCFFTESRAPPASSIL